MKVEFKWNIHTPEEVDSSFSNHQIEGQNWKFQRIVLLPLGIRADLLLDSLCREERLSSENTLKSLERNHKILSVEWLLLPPLARPFEKLLVNILSFFSQSQNPFSLQKNSHSLQMCESYHANTSSHTPTDRFLFFIHSHCASQLFSLSLFHSFVCSFLLPSSILLLHNFDSIPRFILVDFFHTSICNLWLFVYSITTFPLSFSFLPSLKHQLHLPIRTNSLSLYIILSFFHFSFTLSSICSSLILSSSSSSPLLPLQLRKLTQRREWQVHIQQIWRISQEHSPIDPKPFQCHNRFASLPQKKG